MARIKRMTSDPSWGLAIGGGLAGALAFEPVALNPLAPLAPLLAYLAIRQAPRPAAALGRAWVFGWIFSFGTLHWLCTLYRFHTLAPLGIVLLGVYLGAWYGLSGYVLRRLLWSRKEWLNFVCFGALWLLAEWARTQGRLAVPLVQLGHAWSTWPWAIQSAEWLGELGVSLEVLLTAALLLAAINGAHGARSGRRPRHRQLLAPALATVALASLCLIPNYIQTRRAGRLANTKRSLHVALVQPNIVQMTKLASYAHPDETVRQDLQDQITRLTEQMVTGLGEKESFDHRLIVLPETAFTAWNFYRNRPLRARVAEIARRARSDLFFGANRDMSTTDESRVYNSAYLIKADGRFGRAIYDKTQLVPFGESLPYFDLIPGLQKNIVGIGLFAEGERQVLFQSGPFEFGGLICFESTFGRLARSLARQGADMLVVITNDAWYGHSAGPRQHHHLSLLRAVETRRWVLRAANTGISSIIDPRGRVVASLPLGERGTIQRTIEIPGRPAGPDAWTALPRSTFYVDHGNHWLWIIAAFLLARVFWRFRNFRRSEQSD